MKIVEQDKCTLSLSSSYKVHHRDFKSLAPRPTLEVLGAGKVAPSA
jgi:hypothetical protein